MSNLSTFDKIYQDNYKTMYNVAKKIIGDGDCASDIVQEVFIYLYHKLEDGKKILHPRSWLYRATCNKCIDHIRRQKKFQQIEGIEDRQCDDVDENNQAALDAINIALSKLKPQEKIMLVLYSEGLSYKQIATYTGIRFSSIGKMLSRALKKTKQELKTMEHELYQ